MPQAVHGEGIARIEAAAKKATANKRCFLVDLEGNQAVGTLFFNAHNALERYSATDTIRAQNKLYLTTDSKLRSNFGKVMLTIVADTCGRHDTLGGACAAESNTVRYALEKYPMHSCRIIFYMRCT
jgi:hypothetical protein